MKFKFYISPERFRDFVGLVGDKKTITFAKSARTNNLDIEVEVSVEELNFESLHGTNDGKIIFRTR